MSKEALLQIISIASQALGENPATKAFNVGSLVLTPWNHARLVAGTYVADVEPGKYRVRLAGNVDRTSVTVRDSAGNVLASESWIRDGEVPFETAGGQITFETTVANENELAVIDFFPYHG